MRNSLKQERMNTKNAVAFATKIESASNEVTKIKRSMIADTILNTMSFTPIYAMKASLIMTTLDLPLWWFTLIAVIPALFSSDLIVRQMVSSQLSEGNAKGYIIDVVSIGLSFAGLSDGMFTDVKSFGDAFTVQTSMKFLIISLLSVAPVLIIRFSVSEWKKKLIAIVKEGNEEREVYAPDYVNQLEVSKAVEQHIDESLAKMDDSNLGKVGRISKRINKKRAKTAILTNIKKAS